MPETIDTKYMIMADTLLRNCPTLPDILGAKWKTTCTMAISTFYEKLAKDGCRQAFIDMNVSAFASETNPSIDATAAASLINALILIEHCQCALRETIVHIMETAKAQS